MNIYTIHYNKNGDKNDVPFKKNINILTNIFDQHITLNSLLQHLNFYDFIICDIYLDVLYKYDEKNDLFDQLKELKKYMNYQVVTIFREKNEFIIVIDN